MAHHFYGIAKNVYINESRDKQKMSEIRGVERDMIAKCNVASWILTQKRH